MHNYGEALQYQREIAGLSLMDLGRQVGISPQNIGRWERGEVLPNIDFCVRLATFFGITVDELLGITDEQGAKVAAPISDGSTTKTAKTAQERELLELFRELSPYLQGLTLDTVRSWAGKPGAGNVHKKA